MGDFSWDDSFKNRISRWKKSMYRILLLVLVTTIAGKGAAYRVTLRIGFKSKYWTVAMTSDSKNFSPNHFCLLITERVKNDYLTWSSTLFLLACKSHLSGCFWLFAPKFLEVMGTYKLSFCWKRNAASAVLTIWGGGDTQTPLGGKKILNFMCLQAVGIHEPPGETLAPYIFV